MVDVPETAKLVLATHNPHKVDELRAILAPLVSGWRDDWVISAAQVGADEPVEDGTTFSANARIKAEALSRATGLPAVADDSGLCVDILGGAPGIFSARWCGRHGDDQANLDLLLAQLADVADPHRQARFVSAAVLVTPGGVVRSALGELRGRLLTAPRGSAGFGYDPIFVPDGFDVTTAEMSPEEKNAISHRGLSFRQLAPVIATVIELGPDARDEV
ncbi:RdgB/HAM1 family non-canonical purine NTP pyrophosphatase [Nanchangia anserum]|uniref:RdgB/HAM1 family non-canonical purine NTP pyrophosphatase n=1 Tax=Nanchangia anserum TaxID=2692125 RepID=UPI003B831A85